MVTQDAASRYLGGREAHEHDAPRAHIVRYLKMDMHRWVDKKVAQNHAQRSFDSLPTSKQRPRPQTRRSLAQKRPG